MPPEKPRRCTKIGTSKLGLSMPIDRNLNAVSLIALFCILLSWFFIDTFTVTLGSLQHGVHFYDLPAVIADPTRMFFGTAVTFRTFLFGTLCVVCLLLPLAVYLRGARWIWLTLFGPLVLTLICGAMLYYRTSGEFFAMPAEPAGMAGNLIHFANGLVHRGTGAVARHVSIGVGGYLGFAAALWLAFAGVRGFRQQRLAFAAASLPEDQPS
jgi:hypothetical protein